MRISLLTLCSVVCFSLNAAAQYTVPPIENAEKFDKQYAPIQPTAGQFEFIGFRNPPSDDLNWLPSLSKISKNESDNDEMLERIKAEKAKLRAMANTSGTEIAGKTTVFTAPTVSTNFAGINNGGGNTPLDNTIAISNGGKIVAFVNSKVSYYTTTGTATYTKDIVTLINDATLSTNMCDPKVIYDNVKDRFYFYVQTCDALSSTSKVIVGFSKTNDPAAGWYIYKLTGNPLNDNSWFDYPKMGISTNDLYITGNLFFDGAAHTYNQSVVYQIAKDSCLVGGTMSWQFFANITGGFTINPASYGITGSYGPGIYLVSNAGNTFAGGQIKLYQVTNTKASGTAVLNTFNVVTNSYTAPGDADQQGTTIKLGTGDSRVLDAFYLKGIVHFVFNTDAGSGYSGISYNRLSVRSLTDTVVIYGTPGTADQAFPALAAMTNDSNDKSVIIAFNETSRTFYPRTCAIAVSHKMQFSAPVVVKAGVGYIDYFGTSSSTPERWGDYTGMCKKYNDVPAALWMAGMYGSNTNKWSQWIAKLSNKTNIGVPTVAGAADEVKVFPNPVFEDYHVTFTLSERQALNINITDIQGKVVKDLYAGNADAGENRFTFNKANLSTGVYFLNISGNGNLIKTERIVIENK